MDTDAWVYASCKKRPIAVFEFLHKCRCPWNGEFYGQAVYKHPEAAKWAIDHGMIMEKMKDMPAWKCANWRFSQDWSCDEAREAHPI